MSHRAAPSRETEKGIQQAIVEALRWKGYDVRQSTVRHKRCSHCGQYSSVGYGSDRGIADLQVWIPPKVSKFLTSFGRTVNITTQRGYWIWLEVKRPGGKLSPEQQQAEREGKLIVVRSVQEALAAVGG